MPSIGSTIQRTPELPASLPASSPSTASSGRAASSRARIRSSLARSTSVTTSVGLVLVSATSTGAVRRSRTIAAASRATASARSSSAAGSASGLASVGPVIPRRPAPAPARAGWRSSRPGTGRPWVRGCRRSTGPVAAPARPRPARPAGRGPRRRTGRRSPASRPGPPAATSRLAVPRASVSRSQTTSMWSETNPTGTITTPGVPDLASVSRWSLTSGSSHGTSGGPDREQ